MKEQDLENLFQHICKKKEVKVGNEIVTQTNLKFKLFGLITIKEVSVTMTDDKTVFVGGIPLGFALDTKRCYC